MMPAGRGRSARTSSRAISFRFFCFFRCFRDEKKERQQIITIKKATNLCGFVALVPLTELFSNSFMDDLDMIWGLRSIIPDPTTPPVLYRNPDAEDIV